jgi:hypothetical protein
MKERETFSSPPFIFFTYMAASFAVVYVWNWFFPAGKAPLAVYLLKWRFFSTFTDWVNLYPALAFSALIIPFGMKEHSESGYAGSTYIGKKSFSVSFLHYITWPVITGAFAAVLYSAFLFIVLPMVQSKQYLMINRGEFYTSALEKARSHVAAGEWAEAMQYLAVCQGIWPKSAEVQNFRDAYLPGFSSYEERVRQNKSGKMVESASGGQPISAAQAIARAETAFAEERWYDAHWLATLAVRLARPGSAEITPAQVLASRAWNKIAELEPNVREKERFSLYRLKQDGYQAMLANDWITAYYIFKELSALTPQDPDVARYLADSTRNLSSLAFFMDEIEPALGNLIRNPVFSLPLDKEGGRLVFRCSSLVLLPDYAYAWDPELVAVDSDGVFRYRVHSPYGKIIPLSLRDANDADETQTALLLRALDRTDSERYWDPEWTDESGAPFAAIPNPDAGGSQVLLNLPFDDFLLLADTQQTTDNLTLRQLFTVDERLSDYGYLPEIFHAEILRRLAKPVFFLPIVMLVLVAGWRFRARGKPRAVFVLMLAALPAVFYGVVFFLRGFLNDLFIVLSLSFGYNVILAGFIVVSALCFIISLILLASQHG